VAPAGAGYLIVNTASCRSSYARASSYSHRPLSDAARARETATQSVHACTPPDGDAHPGVHPCRWDAAAVAREGCSVPLTSEADGQNDWSYWW